MDFAGAIITSITNKISLTKYQYIAKKIPIYHQYVKYMVEFTTPQNSFDMVNVPITTLHFPDMKTTIIAHNG